jgi:hypothetical protein
MMSKYDHSQRPKISSNATLQPPFEYLRTPSLWIKLIVALLLLLMYERRDWYFSSLSPPNGSLEPCNVVVTGQKRIPEHWGDEQVETSRDLEQTGRESAQTTVREAQKRR